MSQNNSQSDSVQNPRVTWEGCSVLLDINDGDRLVFARLSAAAYVFFSLKNLIFFFFWILHKIICFGVFLQDIENWE